MSVFGTVLHLRQGAGLAEVERGEHWGEPPTLMVSMAVPALLRDDYRDLVRFNLYDADANVDPPSGATMYLDPAQARALRDEIDKALARNEAAETSHD